MSDFMLKQLPYDLSNQAGLAWVGKYLKRININSLIDPAFSVRSGIANSDILKSYLGLLCLGKNDFDAIEGQRMDTHAAAWCELADQHTLHEPHSPVRHTAQRRRLGTVVHTQALVRPTTALLSRRRENACCFAGRAVAKPVQRHCDCDELEVTDSGRIATVRKYTDCTTFHAGHGV